MRFLKPDQYQKSCSEKYTKYFSLIRGAMPEAKIDHIGASSIIGAYSKGDLDIYVEVDSNVFEESIDNLANIGFLEKKDTLRTPELCMLEPVLDEDVAIQLVSAGSKFQFFISFRDALNNEPELVREYNTMKMSFEGKDHASYRDAKSLFIERVLSSL